MDKKQLLINLLNEYVDWKDFVFVEHNQKLAWFDILMDWKSEFLADETVFCIKFWFIEWLVDNNHINMDECSKDEDFNHIAKSYEVNDAITMVLSIHYSSYDLLINRIQ